MKSIRRYLLVSLLVALMIGTALIATAIYFNTKHETDELFDEHLRQVARVILTQEDNLFADPNNVPQIRSMTQKLKGEEEFLIQIWDKGGGLRYSSHPNVPLPVLAGSDIKDIDFQNKRWKTYLSASERWQVQVSQPYQARREMITEIGLNNLIPIIVQIPLLGLLFWIAIGRSMQPLDDLSASVSRKVPGQLQPLDSGKVPSEVRPLVAELNNLMAREHEALMRQQHFTSDAAHELRTPLTAIRLQADILARAVSDDERRRSEEKLQAGIERATHLVQQLLTMARFDGSAATGDRQLQRLAPLIEEIISFQASSAAAKNILIMTDLDPSAAATIDKVSMTTAFNSLIDNAIRYSPDAGTIKLQLHILENGISIVMSDRGSGIPESELPRVFDRFYRISGTSGTGLGLAIAKSIITGHGGTIAIRNNRPEPGLSVIVTL